MQDFRCVFLDHKSNVTEFFEGVLMMTTPNTTSELERGLHGIDVFGFICLGFLVIFTACGNVIICVVILSNRRLRTSSNLLIVNMGLGDILYSLSTLPLSMVLMCFRSNWPLGRAGNMFFDGAWFLFLVLSFLNIQIIALNRFVAITKPYTYKKITTKKRTIVLCVGIWVYASALVFGLSFTFVETDGKVYKFLIPGGVYYSILIFHAVFTFVTVPLLYTVIFHIAKKHKLEIIKQRNANTSRSFFRELKATWTIGFVIGLFLLVWLPFLINQFVDFGDIYQGIWNQRNSIVCYITYCNGPVNIFVYSMWNREIRQMIKKLFGLVKTGSVLSFSSRNQRNPVSRN